MGQIFRSCAYDIETKTCCVYDADKFHANCYAHSGSVFSIHYLLRQKPYNIMWGGGYVVVKDNIKDFLKRPQDILGLSTYLTDYNFDMGNEDFVKQSYYKDVQFICENNKLWNRINVWDEAKKYFDWDDTHSVKYSGYLLNHTRKFAVDLADYYKQSRALTKGKEEIVIDLVPVMTETGGGTMMALFNGASIESTEELAGTWCGDLLQIVDELPKEYEIINCCIAEIWDKARYYYCLFGTDKDSHILKNDTGEKYQCIFHSLKQERSSARYVKVDVQEEGIKYATEPVPQAIVGVL